VHVGRFDLAELAVVLEPEAVLRTARCSLYAGMVALRDALAAQVAPERAITFCWPDAVRIDGGLVGGARLAWPEGSDEAAPPDWLVLGVMVRADDEDLGDGAADRLVESFARRLMAVIDDWQALGSASTTRRFLAHLELERGTSAGLDDNGDLLVAHPLGKRERRILTTALAESSWLDLETGGPRR
jgi:biotin/lipoate A/B protein ligase family protein